MCIRDSFRGDRDAARGVFDDDRPVKFAVEVIGRDESADGDVLRYQMCIRDSPCDGRQRGGLLCL